MGKITGLIFPFRHTFKRLELANHWWHRLAVILFLVVLILAFPFSWIVGYGVNEPIYTVIQGIHHWGAGSNGVLLDFDSYQPLESPTSPPSPPLTSPSGDGSGLPPLPPGATPLNMPIQKTTEVPSGSSIDLSAGWVPVTPVQKTIAMPNGNTATFPGTMSDDAINATWIKTLHRTEVKAVLLGLAMALVTVIVVSYLLQISYRALLYVIFGSRTKAIPGSQISN